MSFLKNLLSRSPIFGVFSFSDERYFGIVRKFKILCLPSSALAMISRILFVN